MKKGVFIVIGILIGIVPSAFGAVVIDRIAAVVNKEVITQSELDATVTPLSPPQQPTSVLHASVSLRSSLQLKQIIDNRVIVQTAERLGVRLTDSDIDEALEEIAAQNRLPNRDALRQAVASSLPWDRYLADLRLELLLAKLIHREIDPQLFLTQEEMRGYYQNAPEQFYTGDQVTLRQVVFRLPSDASPEQMTEMENMAEQFYHDLGAEKREDRGDAFEERAGDPGNIEELGTFKMEALMPELAQVVSRLGIGGITPVIRTPAGFHIFQVTGRTKGTRQSFEEAQPAIVNLLLRKKRETLSRAWFDKIVRQTFIDIK